MRLNENLNRDKKKGGLICKKMTSFAIFCLYLQKNGSICNFLSVSAIF